MLIPVTLSFFFLSGSKAIKKGTEYHHTNKMYWCYPVPKKEALLLVDVLPLVVYQRFL